MPFRWLSSGLFLPAACLALGAASPSSLLVSALGGAAPAPALSVRAVGDMMLGSAFPDGYLPPDDAASSLAAVASLLSDADLTFANLEGPLCDDGETTKCKPDKPPGSCYAFRSPTRYGKLLKEVGIDVVSTANNHAGDFGSACRDSTERTLDGLGIAHSGRSGDVASMDVKGKRVALIAFYTGESANYLNDHAKAQSLVRGLAANHDIVIVSFHGGAEGSKATHVPEGDELFLGENRGDLRTFTHLVIDAGADLVIGHGPHVLRGMELYNDRLIAYSLGNFATYGRFSLSGNLGVGAVLEADLASDGTFLGGQIFPTRQTGKGIPELDPEGKAITLVRLLTAEDFPQSGAPISGNGRIAGARR
jgi:poly-gamma-glutamate capsule biosynthesis protein CapA/YwtB (metallophosphatase superfamily)